MKLSPWQWIVALGVGVVALVLLIVRPFERVEVVVDRGFQGEAARNDYLALEEMLRELGVAVDSRPTLHSLPPTDHVVLMLAPYRGTGEAGASRLVEWARAGGHLVVSPVVSPSDPLLDLLGVGLFDEEDADEDDDESRSAFDSDRPAWPRLYAWGEGVEIVRADGASDAAWMLTVRVGKGHATFVSEGSFLSNERIADKDHALIAWRALALDGVPGAVRLVSRDPAPVLWSFLKPALWPAAASFLLLVAAALVFMARRHGPLLLPEERSRRQIDEHLSALGGYLWSIGCEDALLRSARRATVQRLAGHAGAAESALAELATQTRRHVVEPAAIDEAVETQTTRDRSRFVRIVRTLETLRRST